MSWVALLVLRARATEQLAEGEQDAPEREAAEKPAHCGREQAVVLRRGGPVLGLEERVLRVARVRGRDLAEVLVADELPRRHPRGRESEQDDQRAEEAEEAGHWVYASAAAARAESGRRKTAIRARRRAS